MESIPCISFGGTEPVYINLKVQLSKTLKQANRGISDSLIFISYLKGIHFDITIADLIFYLKKQVLFADDILFPL